MAGRWVRVELNHIFRGMPCLLCTAACKEGDVIFLRRYCGLYVTQHWKCLEGILDDPEIPSGEDKFEQIRNAIMATGDIFVEV